MFMFGRIGDQAHIRKAVADHRFSGRPIVKPEIDANFRKPALEPCNDLERGLRRIAYDLEAALFHGIEPFEPLW